jgi:hypothetical protein
VGHICAGCVERLRSWLTEITELWATLAEVIPTGSVPDETAEHMEPGKQPASPAPLRLDAWSMLNDRARLVRLRGDDSDLPDVPAVLEVLAQRLVDDVLVWTSRAPDTVAGATALLASHLESLAASPWIDELDAELGWLRRSLRRAHGLSRAGRQPVGHCPSLDGNGAACDGPLWPGRDGRMSVDCGKCGRHFDERFLSHLGGMLTG